LENTVTTRQYRLLRDVEYTLYVNVLHSVESSIELFKDQLFFGESIPLENSVLIYIPLPGAKIKVKVHNEDVKIV